MFGHQNTFRIYGAIALGPLDEKKATYGARVSFLSVLLKIVAVALL